VIYVNHYETVKTAHATWLLLSNDGGVVTRQEIVVM